LGADNAKLTYPQIFIGSKLIGGFDALKLLHSSGALYGLLGAANVELSGEPAKLTLTQASPRPAHPPIAPAALASAHRALKPDPRCGLMHLHGFLRAQELAARRAMVPDPYIETTLVDRGILGKSGKLDLPSEVENLYKMEADGTFTFALTERNKAYLNKPDDAGK